MKEISCVEKMNKDATSYAIIANNKDLPITQANQP